MRKLHLVLILAAVVAVGCSDDEEGTGGTGGTASTTIFWTSSNFRIEGDTCDFLVDEELEFRMTISGSDVVLEDTGSGFEVSTDDYDEADDAVRLSNSVDNDDFFPCTVQLDDVMDLELDDPSASLEDNERVEVSWTHVEEDVSDVAGDCDGEWFVDLPCAGEATLTLTQDLQ